MKHFENQAAQGDLGIRRIETIPAAASEPIEPSGDHYVVSHSDSGHHHTIPAGSVELRREPGNHMISYLRCKSPVVLTHHRPKNPHEQIQIPAGTFELRRQRENTPYGDRRVED